MSRQNQGLREGIDSVEAEMASLHGVIEDKDNAVQRLKRDTDRLRRDIKRLQVSSLLSAKNSATSDDAIQDKDIF